MKCWATKTLLREEGKQSAYFFFWRGFARERRRPREMSSFEKSIWNSLTTPEQEQKPYRDGVPMPGQPTAWTALHFGSPGAREGQVLLDALPGRSRRGLLPAPRTKCSGLTAMSLASRCAVQRKRAPCYSCTSPMLSSPTLPSNFGAGVASVFSALHHMWKAWCKQGKKVLVHGLLQRAPRLVGSSREILLYYIFIILILI